MGIKNIQGDLNITGKLQVSGINITEALAGGKEFSEGLTYALSNDNTCYTVTGVGTCTDTDIIIPSTYEGKPVTSISEQAFQECNSLTSVLIPDSITSIDPDAFLDCNSLTSVVIGDSVTSIGSSAFGGCTSLTSVVIGVSVTSISGSAFQGCFSLTSVVIPDSVTSIGSAAFSYCSNLSSVVIGDSVTSIGEGAFVNCNRLKDVYYKGNKESWNNITTDNSNALLTNAANIQYNYADNFMSVNDRLGDVASALELLIAQTNALIGGTE